MARRPVEFEPAPNRYNAAAAEQFDQAAAASAKRRARPRGMTERTLGEAVQALQVKLSELDEHEDYEPKRPGELVLVYAWLHQGTYGCPAGELMGKGFGHACMAAANLARTQFDDDLSALLEFVRWTWAREKDSEEWRRRNGRTGRRITWALQFRNGGILTDYRVAIARQRGQT